MDLSGPETSIYRLFPPSRWAGRLGPLEVDVLSRIAFMLRLLLLLLLLLRTLSAKAVSKRLLMDFGVAFIFRDEERLSAYIHWKSAKKVIVDKLDAGGNNTSQIAMEKKRNASNREDDVDAQPSLDMKVATR
ncbi:hypothetical protein E4U55_000527 [Claviceps digitariae]|nr:hypothetical protein E4U55_000527 [Claviceps digitariae]